MTSILDVESDDLTWTFSFFIFATLLFVLLQESFVDQRVLVDSLVPVRSQVISKNAHDGSDTSKDQDELKHD